VMVCDSIAQSPSILRNLVYPMKLYICGDRFNNFFIFVHRCLDENLFAYSLDSILHSPLYQGNPCDKISLCHIYRRHFSWQRRPNTFTAGLSLYCNICVALVSACYKLKLSYFISPTCLASGCLCIYSQ